MTSCGDPRRTNPLFLLVNIRSGAPRFEAYRQNLSSNQYARGVPDKDLLLVASKNDTTQWIA
jgi:hypothetical protein